MNRSERGKPWLKWVLALVILAAAVTILELVGVGTEVRSTVKDWLTAALDWIRELGAWGVLAFIAIYVICTVLLISGAALTLGAGGVFDLLPAVAIVSVASTIGATIAFVLGRYLFRERVARKIEGNERFRAVDDAVAAEGWKIVLLTRLSPAFPFTFLNYALSLTRISLRAYILASWIGMLPGTVMYVYIGYVAGKGLAGDTNVTDWIRYGVGLAATVAVTVYITRVARRALSKRVETNPE